MNSITIKPFNSAYGSGMNAFITMEQSQYDSADTRAVFVSDINQSHFKFKSISSIAYLEPVIFGLTVGDRIKVEFEMCSLSGLCGVDLQLISLKESGTTTTINSYKTSNSTDGYFKKEIIEFVLPPTIDGNYGIIFNIRAKNLNSEFAIKNITISTDNKNIDFKDVFMVVDCKNRFEKVLTSSVKSEVKVYQNLDTMPKTINANGITFNTSNVGYKGLFFEVGNSFLRTSKAIYVKGVVNSGEIKITNSQYNKNGVLKMSPTEIPLTGSFEKIIFLPTLTDVEYDYLDVGTTSDANFTIEKVIFFKQRYDDNKDFAFSNSLQRG